MPDALEFIEQSDFSAGAFPGMERVPPNGVEDLLNGILREDGGIERRGPHQPKADADNASSGTVAAIWDGTLAAGHRTFWVTVDRAHLLDPSDDETLLDLGAISDASARRPVEIANMVMFPVATAGSRDEVIVYGGATTSGTYSTGTITLTQGSKTVTGSGTTWSTNVTAGQIIYVFWSSSHHRAAVVGSVDSNTQITLVDEWPYTGGTGLSYNVGSTPALTLEAMDSDGERVCLAAAGGKLWAGQGNKVFQSSFTSVSGVERSAPWNFEVTGGDYHLLPQGSVITGLQPIGDGLLVFTTSGVWMVTNVAFDLTDDFGNPQQQLNQISQDIVLWGEKGIATWRNQVLVPGLDDLYVISPSGETVAATGGMRNVYRDYVKEGVAVLQSAVYRGHFIFPVGGGNEILVWRVEGGGAFRWLAGNGFPTAFVARSATSTLTAALLGGDVRLNDWTYALQPPAPDPDQESGLSFTVTFRTHQIPGTVDATWRRMRIVYEMDAGSDTVYVLQPQYAAGPPGSSFSNAGGGETLTVTASSSTDGQVSRHFAVRDRLFRPKVVQEGSQPERLVIRKVEVGVRRSGGR